MADPSPSQIFATTTKNPKANNARAKPQTILLRRSDGLVFVANKKVDAMNKVERALF